MIQSLFIEAMLLFFAAAVKFPCVHFLGKYYAKKMMITYRKNIWKESLCKQP